jgi:hypothetical protein
MTTSTDPLKPRRSRGPAARSPKRRFVLVLDQPTPCPACAAPLRLRLEVDRALLVLLGLLSDPPLPPGQRGSDRKAAQQGSRIFVDELGARLARPRPAPRLRAQECALPAPCPACARRVRAVVHIRRDVARLLFTLGHGRQWKRWSRASAGERVRRGAARFPEVARVSLARRRARA